MILDPDDRRGDARGPASTSDGKLLNAGEAIGEMVSRNRGVRFEGYYNNPEADAERTRNGWYWSGDLGYRDDDGVFWFAGPQRRLDPGRRRELRGRAGRAHPRPASPAPTASPCTPCPTAAPATR